MRKFDYQHLPKDLLDAVSDIQMRLYEDKGKLQTLETLHPEALSALAKQALFDNTDASTRIEGLYVDPARVKELVAHVDEQSAAAQEAPDEGALAKHALTAEGAGAIDCELEGQIEGYAQALRLIMEHADELPLSTGTIVTLYETLFSHRDLGRKSRYRKKDYLYVQVDGHPQAMPVSPITAFETPLVLGGACDGLAEAFDTQAASPLVLAAVFTIDFLCIRPFDEGNGRLARLFATLMLEKAGFNVARYMSTERRIEESGMAYYDALNACVDGWDTARSSYVPYALYWLNILHDTYQNLFDTIDLELRAGNSKAQRVRLFALNAKEPLSKREIMKAIGNVSEATVEAVLGEMVKEGVLCKVGAGRSTAYAPVDYNVH